MDNARKSEEKMSILRHDTRHPSWPSQELLIQQEDCEKALEYLNEVSQTYDDTVIKTYCKNEMVNSVLSIYNTRFEEQRIRWEVQVSIGEKLPCSEMMFCAILSNVLENALHAVQELPQKKRLIQLSLYEKSGHLLLMAKNTVRNAPVFNDGVPVTERSGFELKPKHHAIMEAGERTARSLLENEVLLSDHSLRDDFTGGSHLSRRSALFRRCIRIRT